MWPNKLSKIHSKCYQNKLRGVETHKLMNQLALLNFLLSKTKSKTDQMHYFYDCPPSSYEHTDATDSKCGQVQSWFNLTLDYFFSLHFKVPTGSVQPQAWHDHSADNKAQAESDMAKSQRLRENIFHSIEQTTNDLKVQTDATNFEFRKRMYEMKRAKEELEYQIRKVRYAAIT